MRYSIFLLLVACSPVVRHPLVDAAAVTDGGPTPDARAAPDAPGTDAYVAPLEDAGVDAAPTYDAAVVYGDAGTPMLDQWEVGTSTGVWGGYIAAGMPEAMRADGTSFGATSPPGTGSGCSWDGMYWRRTGPYNCVTWATAMGYCQWQGLRLPTRDEWLAEAALYPPGNETVSASAPTNTIGTCTTRLCDTRGNVAEWVMDSDTTMTGHLAVGAAYDDTAPSLTQVRSSSGSDPRIGFRCRRL